MKNIFSIILFIFVTASLSAQPLNKSTYGSMISTAEESLEKLDYWNALEWFKKAYAERKDDDIAMQIGLISNQLGDDKTAVSYIGRVLKKDKKDDYGQHRLVYARLLKSTGKYDQAIKEFGRYLKTVEDENLKEIIQNEITGAEYAKVAQVAEVTITNAGKKLNEKQSEYSAYLAEGGMNMYYSGLTDVEGKKGAIIDDGKNEEVFAKIKTASKTDDGWGEGEFLGEEINRPGFHTNNVSLSKDGSVMYFTRQQLTGNELSESKIYFSQKDGSNWGPANEVVGVNGDYMSNYPSVGELFGNKVLYFTANMEGGEGGNDIYYATLKSDGVTGDPVNLGPKMNTKGNETTPFYREGILYFASDGHPGIGGYDLFESTWDGSRWSEPKNMGKGYNSPYNDMNFMLDEAGFNGFLISNRDGALTAHKPHCCSDVWNVSLKVIEADVLATAFDLETGDALTGITFQIIEMTDDTEGKTDQQANPNGNDATFGLELDQAYKIIVSAPNYEDAVVEFNTVGMTDSKTFEKALKLKPLPKTVTIRTEEAITLNNILYDFNDDKILPAAEGDLNFIFELMNEYPEMKVELGSHTDFRGTGAANQGLSQRRADSARRYLIGKGIRSFRVSARGYGETQPKQVDSTLNARYTFLPVGTVLNEEYINALPSDELKEIAHQINRRTEFKITSGPKSIVLEETRLIQIGNRKVDEVIKEPKEDKNSMPKSTTTKQDPPKISKLSSLYGRKDLKGLPVMTFNERVIDLGTMKRGEKRTVTYEFTNQGDVDMVVELVTVCECTTIDEDPTGSTYKPGESGKIVATFDSSSKEEGEVISIDIILENQTPGDKMPIIEQLEYTFEFEK